MGIVAIADMQTGVTKTLMAVCIVVGAMVVTIIQAIEMDAFILRNKRKFIVFKGKRGKCV